MSTAARAVRAPQRMRSVRERQIVHEASRLFMQKGYEATTMRELARAVGIKAASLYNHLPSKQEFLAIILLDCMQALVDQIRAAVAAAPPNPEDQMRAAVRAYTLFHDEYLAEASITDTERRGLSEDSHAELVTLRDELSDTFKLIIEAGGRAGVFRVRDLSIDTICVLSICARLPTWFRPDGSKSLEEVADVLSDFVIAALKDGSTSRTQEGG